MSNLLVFNLKTDVNDAVLGFTTDWLNALGEHFDKIFVVTMWGGKIEVSCNIQVFSVGQEKGYSKPKRVLEFYRLLWQLLRTQTIDACFAHMMPLFAVMGWPLLKLKNIPIVLWYAHKSVNPTLRIATLLVDRVVASSKSGFQINTSKLHIIGQGIDTNRFCPSTNHAVRDKPFTVLTVGRLSPVKRVEILIEALAILRQQHPELVIQVKFVGGALSTSDESYAEELKRLAKELGVADWIEFVGSKSFWEVHGYYQAADCFVNSGDTDSVDKAVLEAMSCGIPIVTSNIAFLDILDANLAAEWVIPKGNATALSERLIVLLSMSASERKLLGEKLRQIVVNKHSLPSLTAKLVRELQDLMGVPYEQV